MAQQPPPGNRRAAVRRGNARANLLLLQVNGVRPPLYPEDVGHRVLVRVEKQRKGGLGTPTLEKHALRATTNAEGKHKSSAEHGPPHHLRRQNVVS